MASAQHEDFESLIFGSSLPQSVVDGIPLIKSTDAEKLKFFLKFVAQYAKGRQISRADFAALQQVVELDADTCSFIVVALLTILRLSIKRKFKNDVLLKEWSHLGLVKELQDLLLNEVAVWCVQHSPPLLFSCLRLLSFFFFCVVFVFCSVFLFFFRNFVR
jgi:hypothetical protein